MIIGVKDPRAIAQKDIDHFIKKYKVQQCYVIDKDLYEHFIVTSIPESDSILRHDVKQPFQVISFDKSGKITGKQINCRVNPKRYIPMKLNWSYMSFLDNYPLIPVEKDIIEFPYHFDDLISSLHLDAEGKRKILKQVQDQDYIHVIFVARWFPSITKGLMQDLDKYKAKFNLTSDQFIYVFSDELMLE